jgi:hypothetical protein
MNSKKKKVTKYMFANLLYTFSFFSPHHWELQHIEGPLYVAMSRNYFDVSFNVVGQKFF